jgi:hypothetical protein
VVMTNVLNQPNAQGVSHEREDSHTPQPQPLPLALGTNPRYASLRLRSETPLTDIDLSHSPTPYSRSNSGRKAGAGGNSGGLTGTPTTPGDGAYPVMNFQQEVDCASFELALARIVKRNDHWFKMYQLSLAVLVLYFIFSVAVAIVIPLQRNLLSDWSPTKQGTAGSLDEGAVTLDTLSGETYKESELKGEGGSSDHHSPVTGSTLSGIDDPDTDDFTEWDPTSTTHASTATSNGHLSTTAAGTVDESGTGLDEIVPRNGPVWIDRFAASSAGVTIVLMIILHLLKRYAKLAPGELYVDQVNRSLEQLSLWFDPYSEKLLKLPPMSASNLSSGTPSPQMWSPPAVGGSGGGAPIGVGGEAGGSAVVTASQARGSTPVTQIQPAQTVTQGKPSPGEPSTSSWSSLSSGSSPVVPHDGSN